MKKQIITILAAAFLLTSCAKTEVAEEASTETIAASEASVITTETEPTTTTATETVSETVMLTEEEKIISEYLESALVKGDKENEYTFNCCSNELWYPNNKLLSLDKLFKYADDYCGGENITSLYVELPVYYESGKIDISIFPNLRRLELVSDSISEFYVSERMPKLKTFIVRYANGLPEDDLIDAFTILLYCPSKMKDVVFDGIYMDDYPVLREYLCKKYGEMHVGVNSISLNPIAPEKTEEDEYYYKLGNTFAGSLGKMEWLYERGAAWDFYNDTDSSDYIENDEGRVAYVRLKTDEFDGFDDFEAYVKSFYTEEFLQLSPQTIHMLYDNLYSERDNKIYINAFEPSFLYMPNYDTVVIDGYEKLSENEVIFYFTVTCDERLINHGEPKLKRGSFTIVNDNGWKLSQCDDYRIFRMFKDNNMQE